MSPQVAERHAERARDDRGEVLERVPRVNELPVDQRLERRSLEHEVAGPDVAVDQHRRLVAAQRPTVQPVEREGDHRLRVRDVLAEELAPEPDVLAQRLADRARRRDAEDFLHVDRRAVQQRELGQQLVLKCRGLRRVRDAEEVGRCPGPSPSARPGAPLLKPKICGIRTFVPSGDSSVATSRCSVKIVPDSGPDPVSTRRNASARRAPGASPSAKLCRDAPPVIRSQETT